MARPPRRPEAPLSNSPNNIVSPCTTPVLATFSIRESRRAAVVMMKPVQDRQRDDVPGECRTPVHRLLLVDALMRAGCVVEADKL